MMPTPDEIQAYRDDPFGDDTRPLTADDFIRCGCTDADIKQIFGEGN